jgi:hypothetical protein
MPVFRIAVESVATKVKVNKDEAKKIDERQNDDRNDNELRSPRHSPSRTSGVKKWSHLKWPNDPSSGTAAERDVAMQNDKQIS